MKSTFIYALNDPETGECRYVGKTDVPTGRVARHIIECKGETFRRANWINSLAARGLLPILEILDEVSFDDWKFWERVWIKTSREIGMNLTNTTDGGDGLGSGERHPCFGKKLTPEHRAKISAGGKGLKKPEGFGKNLSVRQSGEKNHRYGKPATKGFSGRKHSSDSKTKIGIKSAAYLKTHNHPQLGGLGTFLGRTHSDAAKEKIRAARLRLAKY